jgi:hypothetical protein
MTKANHFYELSVTDQDNLIDHIIFYYRMIPSINYHQNALFYSKIPTYGSLASAIP